MKIQMLDHPASIARKAGCHEWRAWKPYPHRWIHFLKKNLVGGLEYLDFVVPERLGKLIPIDVHIFQRGFSTTNQILYIANHVNVLLRRNYFQEYCVRWWFACRSSSSSWLRRQLVDSRCLLTAEVGWYSCHRQSLSLQCKSASSLFAFLGFFGVATAARWPCQKMTIETLGTLW